MNIRLYDTATREVRDLDPVNPGEVSIYLCGATVQSAPHVGHLRPAVAFDVLRRWLTRQGLKVTFIRNVTDIDDKILAKAAAAGVEWWAHAARYERVFTRAYDALGVLPPTYEPRATGHVPEMIALMRDLIDAGHAYATTEGNVWFDVRSWPAYGELTRQKLEDLGIEDDGVLPSEAGAVAAQKRDPHDFALWKAPRPGEPATASWDTPWGRGRPGWHLECSAMARRYLGTEFDIHGGGLDLRFPHHENEQAQSRAAGDAFARSWMHVAWVTQQGTKMSKSLGNGLLVSELLEHAPAPVVRYALVSVQYRSMLEWAPDTLDEARTTWDRLTGFVSRAGETVGDVPADEIAKADVPEDFAAAMDDDLNTPAALAVVHEHLRAGNSALASGDDDAARAELVAVRAMLDVLGLDPADPQWTAPTGDRHAAALDALVTVELEARVAARAAKDWATADAIRDRLTAAGIEVQDSADGARWALAGS
ncbi:cysteine--tRNA ligase [Myceligenerans pegani]|uniref:Cysteine--tRNA ligase n=1 Tax=Myceligenerans pegani TaxID=2776917 RepID=A0ABR9MW18_9MICO|nr:cysteine--tRNA ligase [Myceligenerans sp. TRM 65318]MBE1875196.1 cysteine--tRNA ligase [Myceligenerans sp. TRM 65318]MBE3017467.1 cysteine--tRNA ligase [Myceligenerans sp. TRM 65318]